MREYSVAIVTTQVVKVQANNKADAISNVRRQIPQNVIAQVEIVDDIDCEEREIDNNDEE